MRLTTPRTLLAIGIGIAAATGATAALCGPGGHHGDGAECADAQLARLSERLDLTAEQQAQVKTILEEQRAAADQQRAQTRKRIDGVLTDAQRAAQDARHQKRLDRHLDRLSKRLGLSPEQTAQVRTILAERRTNPDLDRTQVQARIAAVLTPEQQKQFESVGPRGDHQGKKGCGPRGDGRKGGPVGGPPDGPKGGRAGGPPEGPGNEPGDEPEDDNGPDGR